MAQSAHVGTLNKVWETKSLKMVNHMEAKRWLDQIATQVMREHIVLNNLSSCIKGQSFIAQTRLASQALVRVLPKERKFTWHECGRWAKNSVTIAPSGQVGDLAFSSCHIQSFMID